MQVQNDHFDEFFAPELDKHGYQAPFKRKTNEVCFGSSPCSLMFTECAEQNLLIHLIIIRSSLVIQTQLMDVLLSTEETGFLMLKNMRYVLVSHFISCIYLGPFA